ncbi:hypothetical protein BJG93_09910 [Paraburkholderia sprentiae WSM5005]|uniref:Zinc ribbon domain-containing protein n=1 Tax=Paraburkholderia sprentiae WSM5005 TaxID=754502 RepID=A0A1I9YH87_9BURK|nr:hypothetical protein [Paraburkholderia sprentiae]APA85670.1 hypothetical protein BJG93_09910 [Paraburkholderia sprentiae WSM5005]
MPRDTTSDQPFFHHCACCGVPLSDRFSPCPACHGLPIDSFDTADKHGERGDRSARTRALSAARTQLEPLPAAASLSVQRSSRHSAQTRMSPYDLIDEATFGPHGRRRRHPLALAAVALATLGAMYVGFVLLHDDNASVDTPVTVFGTVHSEHPAQVPAQNVAQNAAPSVAVAPKPAAPKPASIVAQPPRAVVVARQQAGPAHTAPVAPPAPPVVATGPTLAPTTASSAAISAPRPRGTAVASINAGTHTSIDTTPAPLTQADKLRADAERNLRAARGYLQRGNLSATKARLAAAITAQPDNRDARRMRAQVGTLEQQRDALLSLARGCSNVGHWECASHNANEALRIDWSSKAAQRLVALASHESAWQTMQPSAQESRELRALLGHH